MPIAIKTISITPNKTVTFDFPDNVLAYVVGINYWRFSFGKDDHHVKKLLLSLDSNKPSSKQVTTKISAQIDDDSGHGISDGDSQVSVSCIAVLGAVDNNITLTGANGIPSEGSSKVLPVPSSTLSIGSSFVTGFSLSQSEDHHVKRIQTTAGFDQSGNSGQITALAQISDTSGHSGTGTLNGGLVAASTSERGLLSLAVTNKQTDTSVSVDFGQALGADAAVLLQNLEVTFGSDDHHVKSIGGGCSGWKVEGSKVTLDNARAFVSDTSGHSQDNGASNVSLVVFALPA